MPSTFLPCAAAYTVPSAWNLLSFVCNLNPAHSLRVSSNATTYMAWSLITPFKINVPFLLDCINTSLQCLFYSTSCYGS